MSNPHLAVLDLKTGISTRMDWGFVSNFQGVDFRILRLSDDGNSLWSWGCVRGRSGEGCTSRMYVIDVSPTSPPQGNWTNATISPLGPGTFNSGLRDFSVRGQPNATAFTFVAFNSPSTSPPVLGIYSANYVPRGEITWRSELQPVTVANVDVDASDVDSGFLVAARPPVEPFPATQGILLLRAPLVGVGLGLGADHPVLAPTVIPWPEELPQALRTSNIVQLAHQKPHRLLFAFGRANCISDEIWEVDLSTSRSSKSGLPASAADDRQRVTAPPEQLVSALLSSRLLQGQPDGAGGTQLSWVKCSSRVVFSDVPQTASVEDPIDYRDLDYAWLDIPTDTRTALNTMSRVGDQFIFTFSNGSIFSGVRNGHHIEAIKLISNDSAWLPLSSTAYDGRVYIGERNQSGATAATAIARIRSVDLSASAATSSVNLPTSLVRVDPQLKLVLEGTTGVDDMSTMPASCVPSQAHTLARPKRTRRPVDE